MDGGNAEVGMGLHEDESLQTERGTSIFEIHGPSVEVKKPPLVELMRSRGAAHDPAPLNAMPYLHSASMLDL
jgi:hypothetical protein